MLSSGVKNVIYTSVGTIRDSYIHSSLVHSLCIYRGTWSSIEVFVREDWNDHVLPMRSNGGPYS